MLNYLNLMDSSREITMCMINRLLDNMDTLKVVSCDEELNAIGADYLNDLGFIFVRRSMKCKWMQFSPICCMTVNKYKVNGSEDYYPVVIVDDHFMMFDRNTQIFYLLHELGHYYTQLFDIVYNTEYSRKIEDEYEADEFAMFILGQKESIKALENSKHFVLNGMNFEYFPKCDVDIEDIKFFCADELEMRMMNLELKENAICLK